MGSLSVVYVDNDDQQFDEIRNFIVENSTKERGFVVNCKYTARRILEGLDTKGYCNDNVYFTSAYPLALTLIGKSLIKAAASGEKWMVVDDFDSVHYSMVEPTEFSQLSEAQQQEDFLIVTKLLDFLATYHDVKVLMLVRKS